MAEFKRRTLILCTSKQIRLYGNSMAIGPSLEIGEGSVPNIFSQSMHHGEEKATSQVSNPHQLTSDELLDMADYNIQLWMDLKAAIRKYGAGSSKIFKQE